MRTDRGNLRILLIDDDEAIRRSISFIVRAIGHHIVTVASVAEGLAYFAESRPQLVITDMMLPTVSGVEAVSQIRAQSAEVTIVAISGSDDRDRKGPLSAAREAGADYCLSKPFSLTELERLLDDVTRKLAGTNGDAP